jgi:hypothetical protein
MWDIRELAVVNELFLLLVQCQDFSRSVMKATAINYELIQIKICYLYTGLYYNNVSGYKTYKDSK